MRYWHSLALTVVIFSCNHLGNEKVSAEDLVEEEINAINWTSVDSYPSFAVCDSLETKSQRKSCFETILTSTVNNYLSQQTWRISEGIEDTAKLKLTVEHSGDLTIDTVILSSDLQKNFPKLDSLLHHSLDSLPKIYPAIKRGQQVRTQFELPIRVVIE